MRVTEETKAMEIYKTLHNHIMTGLGNPMFTPTLQEKITAYEMSIIFAQSLYNELQWWQVNSKLYWKEVIHILMKEKIICIEYNNKNYK